MKKIINVATEYAVVAFIICAPIALLWLGFKTAIELI